MSPTSLRLLSEAYLAAMLVKFVSEALPLLLTHHGELNPLTRATFRLSLMIINIKLQEFITLVRMYRGTANTPDEIYGQLVAVLENMVHILSSNQTFLPVWLHRGGHQMLLDLQTSIEQIIWRLIVANL